jgi:CheY-like chemotaxis protein
MPKILVVADVSWVRNEVHAALTEPDFTLVDHEDPATAAARASDENVDAVVVDMQVGAMGGMAVTRALRDASIKPGVDDIPAVIMLDRSADVFLAKRAGAAGWVTKPFTTYEIESALAGAIGAVPHDDVPDVAPIITDE